MIKELKPFCPNDPAFDGVYDIIENTMQLLRTTVKGMKAGDTITMRYESWVEKQIIWLVLSTVGRVYKRDDRENMLAVDFP